MDEISMIRRNYKIQEEIRRKNEREQKNLDLLINSKRGMQARHRHSLDEVEKEKRIIRRELQRIRKSSFNTNGKLPPRDWRRKMKNSYQDDIFSSTRGKKTRKQERYQQRTEEELKEAEEKLRNFTDDLMETMWSPAHDEEANHIDDVMRANGNGNMGVVTSRRESPKAPTLSNISLAEARENINKRLSSSAEDIRAYEYPLTTRSFVSALEPLIEVRKNVTDISQTTDLLKITDKTETNEDTLLDGQVKKKKKKDKKKEQDEDESEEPAFDSDLYHPDGHLRTVHKIPDLDSAIKQAKKARYVRHKEKQWFERELTLREIFPILSRIGKKKSENG